MPRRREVARALLDVFEGQQSRPGYVLNVPVIIALAERKSWAADETSNAILYGLEQGWFESKAKLFLALTDVGLGELGNHA